MKKDSKKTIGTKKDKKYSWLISKNLARSEKAVPAAEKWAMAGPTTFQAMYEGFYLVATESRNTIERKFLKLPVTISYKKIFFSEKWCKKTDVCAGKMALTGSNHVG